MSFLTTTLRSIPSLAESTTNGASYQNFMLLMWTGWTKIQQPIQSCFFSIWVSGMVAHVKVLTSLGSSFTDVLKQYTSLFLRVDLPLFPKYFEPSLSRLFSHTKFYPYWFWHLIWTYTLLLPRKGWALDIQMKYRQIIFIQNTYHRWKSDDFSKFPT